MEMRVYSSLASVSEPPVTDGQLYIYVVENRPQGNIKIGKSSNVRQRFKSLSGSNGGGNKLVKFAVSPVTYLYTIERIAHSHFRDERIDGTEWFDGCKVSFDEAVAYLNELFNSAEYEKCNTVRKEFTLKYGPTIGCGSSEVKDSLLDEDE